MDIEKTAAAALAKAEALEAVLESDSDELSAEPTSRRELQIQDPAQCTQEYVLKHKILRDSIQSMPPLTVCSDIQQSTIRPKQASTVSIDHPTHTSPPVGETPKVEPLNPPNHSPLMNKYFTYAQANITRPAYNNGVSYVKEERCSEHDRRACDHRHYSPASPVNAYQYPDTHQALAGGSHRGGVVTATTHQCHL